MIVDHKSRIEGTVQLVLNKFLYVLDLAEALLKFMSTVLLSTFISFVSVALCWAAIQQLESSSLPHFSSHKDLGPFLSFFYLTLLALDSLYGFWILDRVHASRSTTHRAHGNRRSDRIAIATFWPFISSIVEVILFRLLWTHYEIPATLGAPLSINPLIDFEDIATILLIVSWLTWTKKYAVSWIAKIAGASLAPVVGVMMNGNLLLADGTSIPFVGPENWPRRGLGRSRISCVISWNIGIGGNPELVDVLVTEGGDAYFSPPSPRQKRRWRASADSRT